MVIVVVLFDSYFVYVYIDDVGVVVEVGLVVG